MKTSVRCPSGAAARPQKIAVGSGFVSNLAHPGGNITGFHSFEPAIAGKWLEVLKELAPGVSRAAVVHHPNIAANVAFVRAAELASSRFGVTVTAAAVRNATDIEELCCDWRLSGHKADMARRPI